VHTGVKMEKLKELMQNKKLMTWGYWIMIFIVIITCILVVFWLMSDARQCMANPMAMYMEQTGQECFCMDKFGITP